MFTYGEQGKYNILLNSLLNLFPIIINWPGICEQTEVCLSYLIEISLQANRSIINDHVCMHIHIYRLSNNIFI